MIFFQYDTDGSGQIEFPEFCNMMSAKMGTVNDEDMIRMAFRVLDKDGRGTIKSSAFKHLMTHIGKLFISTQPQHLWFGILDFSEWYQEMNFKSDLGML